MWPPAIIVRGSIANSHLQMAFVEWDQKVETFATETAAQSLAHRVRFRGAHRRSQNPHPQIGKTLVDILREDAVAVVDEEAIRMITRQRFSELLQRPFRRGMSSYVLNAESGGIQPPLQRRRRGYGMRR